MMEDKERGLEDEVLNQELRAAMAELSERRAAEAVRTTVERTLIRRYSWIGAIVAIVTSAIITFLVKANVDSALLDSRTNLAVSEALQARNMKALDDLENALDTLKDLEEKLTKLDTKASDVETKVSQIAIHSVALRQDQFLSTSDVLTVSEGLELRISELEESFGSTSLVRSPDSSAEAIETARVRATRRKTRVEISGCSAASELAVELREVGFSVSISDDDDDIEKSQSIWWGNRIPLENIKAALPKILSSCSHLRFHQISGDFVSPPDSVHDELYIGGATSTAIERGHSEILPGEMISAVQDAKTIQELHAFVRSRYTKSFEVEDLVEELKR